MSSFRHLISTALTAITLAASVANAADQPSPQPVLRIEGGMHTAHIKNCSVDASGRICLTVSEDKTARLWDTTTGALLRILRIPIGDGFEGQLFAGALTPDGGTAWISGFTAKEWDNAGCIYVMDTASGRCVGRIGGYPQPVFDIRFSKSGELVAIVGGGFGVEVCDARTGKLLALDGPYEGDANGVDWYGNDALATVCYGGKVRIYNLKGEWYAKGSEKAKTLTPRKVVETADGKAPQNCEIRTGWQVPGSGF
jgi:WD40 repeat protein